MGRSAQGTMRHRGRYVAVPRTLCFITHEDDVLLLRGAPDKPIWPSRFNGIGGHVERGEDIYSAALREIREETGTAVADLRLRGIVNVAADPEGPGVLIFVFTARALSRDVRASTEGAPIWVHRERLSDLDLVEDLPHILPRVLSMAADEAPFFAHYVYTDADQLAVTFAPQ